MCNYSDTNTLKDVGLCLAHCFFVKVFAKFPLAFGRFLASDDEAAREIFDLAMAAAELAPKWVYDT